MDHGAYDESTDRQQNKEKDTAGNIRVYSNYGSNDKIDMEQNGMMVGSNSYSADKI